MAHASARCPKMIDGYECDGQVEGSVVVDHGSWWDPPSSEAVIHRPFCNNTHCPSQVPGHEWSEEEAARIEERLYDDYEDNRMEY